MSRGLATRERLAIIGVLALVWSLGIGARLVHLQVYERDTLVARAIRQHERTVSVSATRGRLLDARGRELACSVEAQSVYATVADIRDPAGAASALAPILDVPVDTLRDRLTSSRTFVCLKRKVEAAVAARVAALGLEGIAFVPEMKRVYPKGELAAHVLGYCSVDGEGLAGLELTLDDRVRGREGRVVLSADARSRVYEAAEIAPLPGDDVQLTIDEVAQYRVERELAKGVRSSGANWGVAIVLRPRTGEVVAMASCPTFDANDFGRTDEAIRRNRAVEAVFEPGSVFKVVPYSGCLEEGLVTPATRIDCQYGSITVANRVVHDTPYGELSVAEALAYSSNVAAIKMGMKLGNERFYQYIRAYGFGERTGIELPGESPGVLRPAGQWQPTSIGSIPMGHEVSVTALQAVAAMAALANGGEWVQPHLVSRILAPDGTVLSHTQPAKRRVVRAETAAMMTEMLEQVVVRGTAKHAGLGDIRAAGKTGTAQKIDRRTGGYSHSRYVATFCGFAPADAPELACIVVLDEPHIAGHTGGAASAPVFGAIMEALFADFAVVVGRPDEPQDGAARRPIELAHVEPVGPPTPLPDVEGPQLDLLPARAGGSGVVVPDLTGLGLRAALQAGAETGLEIRANGSGNVISQKPLPGSLVPPGSPLFVELRR